MQKIIILLVSLLSFFISNGAHALLNLELTRGMAGALPIAIVSFAAESGTSQNISNVVANDLAMSGRFKVYSGTKIKDNPSELQNVKFNYFRSLGADNIVIGKVEQLGSDQYQVRFQLLDSYKGKDAPEQSVLLNRKFVVSANQLRPLAHHISDLIYEHLTGVKGIFSTSLAYIVVKRESSQPTRYNLEVADFDGFNPRPLLSSTDPIMSPAWSPDGKKIAYVTFERKHAAIYIQDLSSARRTLVSEFEGINGAPAWSPDGRKLALVLSKDGSPNIYTMDLDSKNLTSITKDWSINTEPAWSPDGKSIIFTSNRSGNPQIYQKNLSTGELTRVTYNGNYNARASFTRDGNHIVVLNKQSNLYNIGILDLNTGNMRVLTNAGVDNDSPSIAPNSSMVLYGTLHGGRNVLGMVATDASVQLRIPARDGEVQDPSWSPFLT